MSGNTLLRSRKSTLMDRKDATSPDGEDFSLREDEEESNDRTRDSTRRHRSTLQQVSSPPHLWSSKQMLALALVFVVPLAYSVKLNQDCQKEKEELRENVTQCRVDSREQIVQLQLNNSDCLAKTHQLIERVDELKNKSGEMERSLSDTQKEKEELRDKETQCRLDSREQMVQLQNRKEKVDELNNELEQTKKSLSDTQKEKKELRDKETECKLDMKNVEIRHAKEKNEAEKECRLDMNQRSKAERDKLEYEYRLLIEQTEFLIECLGRQNQDQDSFFLTRAFNAIVRAIESGLGRNSDVQNCLKLFSSRFQRRISA